MESASTSHRRCVFAFHHRLGMSHLLRAHWAIIGSGCCLALQAQTQFEPVELAAGTYNADVVVERSAPGPVLSATSASMDTGWTNTGYAWFERGYHLDWLAIGLPSPGAVVTSDLLADHEYQFPPDYRTNNVLMVDAAVPTAGLRLASPVTCRKVSLLFSGMHDGTRGVLGYRITHEDGSVQSGSVVSPDWLERGYSAYTANGRVEVTAFTFRDVIAGTEKLFQADVTLTNTTSAIREIEFSHVSGIRSVVFALSAQVEDGGGFVPVPVWGYNADVVVEAGASRPQSLSGATSASMESGWANTLRTWYEEGYVPGPGGGGLPRAGTVLTNRTDIQRCYRLASSFEGDNAVLLDQAGPVASLALAIPGEFRALSFLTASAGGPVTNECVAEHVNGTRETNTFVSPDWMSASDGVVWSAGGRVNLNTRLIDGPAGGGPKLFWADVTLSVATSAVTNVWVRMLSSSASKRVVIFALSGEDASAPARPAVLTIDREPGGMLEIRSSEPGMLEWTDALVGTNTVWVEDGLIEGARSMASGPGTKFWRVRALGKAETKR